MATLNTFFAGAVCALALLLAGCQQPLPVSDTALSTEMLQHSRIEATATGQSLTPATLLDQLSQAPLLIIGEEHTNPQHHQIEQWIMESLAQRRPQGSVLMEMLTIDQQPLVEETRRAIQAGSYLREPRIQQLLQWNSGWPWSLYRGVVLSALRAKAPLLAANLTAQQTGQIYRSPYFPPGKNSNAPQVRELLSSLISRMHSGSIPAQRLNAMLAIQQSRDRFMAQQLLRAPRPALLLAGSVHAAKDTGVPLHTQDVNGEKPLVLMLASPGMQVPLQQADYVWYTPLP